MKVSKSWLKRLAKINRYASMTHAEKLRIFENRKGARKKAEQAAEKMLGKAV